MFDFPLIPEQASSYAGDVDNIYFFLVAMTAVMAFIITVLVIYFAARYHRKNVDEIGSGPHGSVKLEIIWTIIPVFVVMGIFFWGTSVFYTIQKPPEDTIEMWVVGKQWMWKFQQPNGKREINELHVPRGQAVKLTMTSQDVIHSFFVPAFRVKQDILPGRYTTVWFEATKAGEYHLFCAEYCGTNHSKMMGKIIVQEPVEYAEWLVSGGTAQVAASSDPTEAGLEMFNALACNTCHKEGSSGLGPTLNDLYGSEEELADGTMVLADDTYIRESILNPAGQIVKGFQPVMPTYQGQVTEEGLTQLIMYIRSIGGELPADAAAESEAE